MINKPFSSRKNKKFVHFPTRVLILGSNGFVANSVKKILIKKKIKVLNLPKQKLDLTKKNSLKKLAKIIKKNDTLFFAAAKAPVKNSKMFLENLLMCQTVCGALRNNPVNHLVYLSSDAVYSDSKNFITEKSSTRPDSLHGLMHLTREIMLKEVTGKFLSIIRPTLIYGLKDPHNGYGPNKFFRLAIKNKDISLFGKGEELRDHVWIEDVAQIILNVICEKNFGIQNVATGKVDTFSDIAKKIIKLTHSKSKIINLKRKSPIPHNGYRAFNIVKCKKFYKNFRFKNLADGYRHIYFQYKK